MVDLSDARNVGVGEAKAEVNRISLYSDDYIDEDMYELLINNLKAATQIYLCVAITMFIIMFLRLK